MARQLMVHMFAERERALAEGTPTPRSSWHGAATGLIDAHRRAVAGAGRVLNEEPRRTLPQRDPLRFGESRKRRS